METMELLATAQRLRRRYQRQCQQIADVHGMHRIELEILLFLANNPACDTARDIVALRNLTKSHVSQGVSALLARGYLDAAPDVTDKRCMRLSVTAAAGGVVVEGQRMQRAFFEALFVDFSPPERAQFAQMLRRVAQRV